MIAEALPAIGTVVSCTANDAALLSHTGEYSRPALPGEALVCGEELIGLRMHPGLIHDTLLTPRALTMSGESGTHRAYLTPMSDRLVVEALGLAPAQRLAPVAPVDWSTFDWRDGDQITHLDAMTPERYRVLPFAGARRIDPRVIPPLLAHLAEVGLAFTIAVPGGGCVQLHRGRAAMVEHAGEHVAAVFGAARYAVDPVAVAECWVTQAHGTAGRTSTVELYDHSHRWVTAITQTGAMCSHVHDAWEAIAASLPTAEE